MQHAIGMPKSIICTSCSMLIPCGITPPSMCPYCLASVSNLQWCSYCLKYTDTDSNGICQMHGQSTYTQKTCMICGAQTSAEKRICYKCSDTTSSLIYITCKKCNVRNFCCDEKCIKCGSVLQQAQDKTQVGSYKACIKCYTLTYTCDSDSV